MMVPQRSHQATIMLQALTNHNPDIIIVDELSEADDVRAARSICQRGVALVATAHAGSLSALLANPELNPLVGGLHEVILSDTAVQQLRHQRGGQRRGGAFRRAEGSKTRQERRGPPMFRYVVELVNATEWRIHWDVAASVDALLNEQQPETEVRRLVRGRLLSRMDSEWSSRWSRAGHSEGWQSPV
jgi:hypothetical protein